MAVYYPYNIFCGPNREVFPSPAEAAWNCASIARYREARVEPFQWKLIAAPGHAPLGGPSPAVLALHADGQLLSPALIAAREKAYFEDNEASPNYFSRDQLEALWEKPSTSGWLTLRQLMADGSPRRELVRSHVLKRFRYAVDWRILASSTGPAFGRACAGAVEEKSAIDIPF